MLNLHYIIIGSLPKQQQEYLEQNLNENKLILQGAERILLEKGTKLQDFMAQESIFISADERELHAAADYGMATLGYLPPGSCAGKRSDKQTDDPECPGKETCPDIDMWAEGFEEINMAFLVRVYQRHHGLPWTILTTERCVVKEFSMDYLDDLFGLYAGEGMTDYIEPLYSYEQEKEYQKAYIENMYGFYGYGMWIVCEKQTGKLIGRAGVEYREELGGELELGYAIGVPYQRKGYATEVCEAILNYVEEELLQTSVCCLIEEGNVVSEHFAEKLGFSLEKNVIINKKHMKKYTYVF